jgi:hypothetical protein
LQINPRESEPRFYLRKLQAGGAHSFEIENYSPGEDGQSRGLRLRVTYSVREPRFGEGNLKGPDLFRIYGRYIEASLYTLESESAHARVQSAIEGELNEVLNRLRREDIQEILAEGKHSRNTQRGREYEVVLQKAKNFISEHFGLLIDLSVSVASDDPKGIASIILESDAKELGARLQIESGLRVSKAEAAREAWNRYHEALKRYDSETADKAERDRLTELKQTAEELEKEAEMGKRAHIGRQLQSDALRTGRLSSSRVLGIEDDSERHNVHAEPESGADNVIDIKAQKS